MKTADPFKWDGSSLGILREEQIFNKQIIGRLEYWTIQVENYYTVCIAKTCREYTACFVDELKSVFGLIKLGTHHARYKSVYVILIRSRADINCERISSELFLHKYKGELYDELIIKIKKIYVFRDLLCLNKSTDTCIILRRNVNEDQTYPCSIVDSGLSIKNLTDMEKSTSLSDRTFKKWLDNDSPARILAGMCKIRTAQGINARLFKLRKEFEVIIKRVSNDAFIGYADIIMSRINSKISLHFSRVQAEIPIKNLIQEEIPLSTKPMRKRSRSCCELTC